MVGAGIAGLGAARALRQHDLAADVVEQERAWTHAGAGIYLPGNAARALRALGLESAVAARIAEHAPTSCDHRGQLLADIDLATLWGNIGPCFALHRADLHDVLATHGDPVPVRIGSLGVSSPSARPKWRRRTEEARRVPHPDSPPGAGHPRRSGADGAVHVARSKR